MNRNPLLFTTFEKIILPLLDIITLVISFSFASYVRFGLFNHKTLFSIHFILILLVVLLSLYIFDTFNIHTNTKKILSQVRTLYAIFFSAIIIMILTYILGRDKYIGDWFGRGILPISLLSFTFCASLSRYFIIRWFNNYTQNYSWLVLGNIQNSKTLYRDFSTTFSNSNFALLVPKEHNNNLKSDIPIIGNWDEFDTISKKNWNGIIVNDISILPENILNQLMQIKLQGIMVYDLITFYEDVWFKIPIICLKDAWIATSRGFHLLHHPYQLKLKRIFDLIISSIFLFCTLPILISIAIILFLTEGRPLIYKQKRTGKSGKLFTIYKFRTMVLNAEQNGHQWAQKADQRITSIGKILRKLRIDEWPQCYNVLKGDMSFIGPRPERPEFNIELKEKLPYYNLRHLVRPGITGWAQILYPYGASVEDAMEKLQYDLYYIKNYSVAMDIIIILKTIRVILLGKGF